MHITYCTCIYLDFHEKAAISIEIKKLRKNMQMWTFGVCNIKLTKEIKMQIFAELDVNFSYPFAPEHNIYYRYFPGRQSLVILNLPQHPTSKRAKLFVLNKKKYFVSRICVFVFSFSGRVHFCSCELFFFFCKS